MSVRILADENKVLYENNAIPPGSNGVPIEVDTRGVKLHGDHRQQRVARSRRSGSVRQRRALRPGRGEIRGVGRQAVAVGVSAKPGKS